MFMAAVWAFEDMVAVQVHIKFKLDIIFATVTMEFLLFTHPVPPPRYLVSGPAPVG